MPWVRAKLGDGAYRRVLRQKQLDGFADASWAEWLAWAYQDVELNPGLTREIQRTTRSELEPMWMKSLAVNLPKIRASSLTLRDLKQDPPVDRKCLVLGRGPSILKPGVLKAISSSEAYEENRLDIVASDGILKNCLEAGVEPDLVVTVDGSDVIEKFYQGIDPLSVSRVKAVISTQASPKAVEAVESTGMPLYWFQPGVDSVKAARSVTKHLMLLTCWEGNPNGVVSIDCLGNTGASCFMIAWQTLQRKDICLLGLDMGYPKNMPLEETYYWSTALGVLPPMEASKHYELFHNPATGEDYVIDPVFQVYRSALFDTLSLKPDWLRVCNASSGTLYFPPHIENVRLEDWLNEQG